MAKRRLTSQERQWRGAPPAELAACRIVARGILTGEYSTGWFAICSRLTGSFLVTRPGRL